MYPTSGAAGKGHWCHRDLEERRERVGNGERAKEVAECWGHSNIGNAWCLVPSVCINLFYSVYGEGEWISPRESAGKGY